MRAWWGADLLYQVGDGSLWAGAAGRISRGRFRDEVARLATTLERHGIRAGHSVALCGSPSFTQLWTIFALWSLGAQVVLLDPRLSQQEHRALLELCSPQCCISFGGLSPRGDVFVDECEVLVRWLPAGRPMQSSHCVVQFSSGTTGQIKAIGRTPESLLGELDRLRRVDGMPRAGERVLLLEWVSHSFTLVCGVLHALDVGAAVLFAPRNRPDRIAAMAADAHVIMGSPRHFDELTAAPGSLPRLRLAVSGGEPLPHNVYDRFADRFGVRIGQAYGTTETGIVAADLDGACGPRAVGRPVDGVRTKIVDGVLNVHVPGSPYLYENRPWMGGWLSTQDMAAADPETGVLRLRGRIEGDTGSVDPAVDLLEIEAVLQNHRHVDDAVVLGVDPIEAHVVGSAELDHQDLRRWCRHFLGVAATPSRYHLLRELPRTGNGKVARNRRRLREHTVDSHPRKG
jgi:3-hydroxy-4-methylanthranilate adenylyltransferase